MTGGLRSGIALELIRKIDAAGARPDNVLVHPTRAALLQAVVDQAIVELGSRPPWWRPIARRRWRQAFGALLARLP